MAGSESPQAAPRAKNDKHGSKSDAHAAGEVPRVIPSGQMVILRENDLDCDLPTAIQRVRENEDTSGSRILIVAPDEEPPPQDPSLPLPRLPMSVGRVARTGGERALMATGERIAGKVDSLGTLLDELGIAVADVEEVAHEGTPARLHSKTRIVRDILDWITANAADLRDQVEGMRSGYERVDLYELVQEVCGQVESFFPHLRVNLSPVEGGEPLCWGRATELMEALFLSTVISAHRIGGRGSINLQVIGTETEARLRILGLGEPVATKAPEEMARIRQILVAEHGGRIVPDALGAGGTGIIIALPRNP